MAEPSVIIGTLSDSELTAAIDKLVNHVAQKSNEMADVFDQNINRMLDSLNKLGRADVTIGVGMGGSLDAVGNQEKLTKAISETTSATQELTNATNRNVQSEKNEAIAYDQIASARQKVASASDDLAGKTEKSLSVAKEYTEEVKKQAKAIRESQQWKEKGFALVGDTVYYDPERSKAAKKDRLSLEEQILKTTNEQQEAERRAIATEYEATEAAREEARIREMMRQGIVATNEQLEKARKLSNQGFGVTLSRENDTTISGFSIQLESIKALNEELKRLKTQYDSLTHGGRFGQEGQNIAMRVREITRQVQILANELNRPTKKEIAGLSEKTLEDIAYKIQALQRYRSGLNIVDPKQKDEIAGVNAELDRLKRKQDEVLGKNQQLFASNTALGRSWNYMKNRLAFYFTIGASTQFVKQLIDIRSQYEMTEKALGVLINSAERGSQIFNELSQMALVSPYTLIELSGAAKQLVAYDVAAKDVVDTTRRLADMAAAVGIPLERLTYALGQIKAYGYLNARDARMFANAGIPLVKQLSDYYTQLEGRLVSTADVYDRIKHKAISYTDVMSVVNYMTDEGGKFFDFQAKMAETLKVKLANLTLAWNNMLNEIGDSYQGLLSGSVTLMKNMFMHWKELSKAIYGAAIAFGAIKGYALVLNVIFGKQAYAAIKAKTSIEGATAATYQNELADMKLTRSKAILLAAIHKNNIALKEALVNLKLITAAEASNIPITTRMGATWNVAINGIKTGVTALKATLSSFLPMLAVFAVADIAQYVMNLGEIDKAIGEGISNSAKEATDSIRAMFKALNDTGTLAGIKDGTASATELEKAWVMIREEIEKSSDRGKEIVEQLLLEEDLSKRITKAMDIADAIEKANNKMKDFTNEIKISEDEWWSFLDYVLPTSSKGLINDVKKAGEVLEQLREEAGGKKIGAITFGDIKEVEKEMEKLAESAKRTFSKYNIVDPEEIRNALERVRSQIKEQGNFSRDAARIFDIEFDKVMAKNFDNVHDQTTTLWRLVLGTIKNDTAGAFQGITEDILSTVSKWTPAQLNAIEAAFQKVKKSVPPEWFKVLDDMQSMLNEREFKAKILAEFDFERTNLQKEYDKRVKESGIPLIEAVRPQDSDDFDAWVKKRQDEIKKLEESNEKLKKDNKAWSKEQIKLNQHFIDQNQKALDLFNQSYAKDKKGKDVVLEALRMETELVKKLQSAWEKLVKAGYSYADAMQIVRGMYGKTVESLNRQMSALGLPKLDLSILTGRDPNEVLDFFRKVREALEMKGLNTKERLKVVEGVIEEFTISAKTFNMKKMTEGLNNELGRLKDEYELAVQLDAEPELGDVFADMMGLDKDKLAGIPRDFEGVVRKMQSIIDKNLAGRRFVLLENLNKADFQKWVESSGKEMTSDQIKELEKYVDYANKVRRDETKKQVDEWNKLLEKYAEYEYKKKQINDTYEREMATARKKGASGDIIDSITNRRDRDFAQLDFDEFIKTQSWVTATGDLAMLSNKAIGLLITRLEEYKKSAKNLDPKAIKNLNNALSKLYKEQRKSSPFKAIEDALAEAKERAAEYQDVMDSMFDEIRRLKGLEANGDITESQRESLEKLEKEYKRLRKEQKEVSTIDASQWVSAINTTIGAVSGAISIFNDLAKAIGGVNDTDFDKITSFLSSAGSAAATGAIIGGGVGAIVGAVVGAATSLISIFSQLRGEDINNEIKESELAVKNLERAYKNLEYEIQKAYGTASISAKKIAISNKEAQLAELKRQLALEQSRDSKDRDEERIEELKGQIIDLENDIRTAVDDIVNDLLGISSIGDAAENLMSQFIDALRKGEDAMSVFNSDINNMIANMVMKMLTTKIIQPWFDEVWNQIQSDINARTSDAQKRLSSINQQIAWAEGVGDSDWEFQHISGEGAEHAGSKSEYLAWLNQQKKSIEDSITDASQITVDDIRKYAELLRSGAPIMDENMKAIEELLRSLGLIDDTANKNLSALQQGIQGVTEDTAGAIEAYMNIIAQRMFEQNDYLMQIRDAVVGKEDVAQLDVIKQVRDGIAGLDSDIQLSTMSMILLQLQASYQVQMSVQNLLSGWSNASDTAVRVEIV